VELDEIPRLWRGVLSLFRETIKVSPTFFKVVFLILVE
jgi:hypothetical protein